MLEAKLGELHALGAFGQRPLVGLVLDHVANEVLPLDLEAVVVDLRVRDLLPLVEEIHHLLLVRIPYRARRGDARLRAAAREARDGRAVLVAVELAPGQERTVPLERTR